MPFAFPPPPAPMNPPNLIIAHMRACLQPVHYVMLSSSQIIVWL